MRFLTSPLKMLAFSFSNRLTGSSKNTNALSAKKSFILYTLRLIGVSLFVFIVLFNSFFIYQRIFADSRFMSRKNPTLGFSHIYVIIANSERHEYVDAILKYHNLKYEAFPAIGKDSDLVNTTVTSMWEKSEGLNDFKIWGKIGCWASHRAVWTDALEKKYSNFLVLEDDIDVHLDLAQIVQAGWNGLPTRWDYYFLGSCFASYSQEWFSGPLRKVAGMACTHAYGVNSHIIPKLLEWSDYPPTGGIDLQVMTGPLQNGVVEAYGLVPPVIVQRPLALQHQSAIGNEREPVFLDGTNQLMKDDWRLNDVLPIKDSSAEKLHLAYWY